MAVKIRTTYTYICDLCGIGYPNSIDLENLYKPERSTYLGPHDYYEKAMICISCQSKPISALLEYFRRKDGT